MELLVFIYGLIIGSFLNVCIYRIPREESIIFPFSHCPKCNTNLKFHDLVPVFSFIVYKGRCRYCGEKISPQYPIIEILTATIYILLFYKYGLSLEFLFYLIIFSFLIIITVIDLKYMIIPDVLIALILGTTIAYKIISYLLYGNPVEFLNSILGLISSSLLFIIIILISKGGMGGGDVTLIGSLGFILGFKNIVLTIFLSFILGGIISTCLLITKIKGRKDPIPFGPFIIIGFTITIFWGEPLITWYLSNYFY